MSKKPPTFTAVAIALLAAAAGPAHADFKRCRPVLSVLDGTMLEGDLFNVRAQAVSCRTARRVARKGTRKAVAGVPNSRGRVVVRYRRWLVVDDLRGPVDRFRARAPGRKRVRWLFGDI